MADSPAHKFGQIIGDSLEAAIYPILNEFSKLNNLFLDVKGPRPARKGNKVTWQDNNNNKHDLDFVIERNGTPEEIGKPVAFIECAWRRYTKHSRNKAQEIQGAIIPLFEKYRKDYPFIGVILAGEFTEGSLSQLESLGFSVLYFSYESIIKAFQKVKINAFFDEKTKDSVFANEVHKWEALPDKKKLIVYKAIADNQKSDIIKFIKKLKSTINRNLSEIKIWPFYGKLYSFKTIQDATTFINGYNFDNTECEFIRFDAEIIFSNGDIVKVSFKEKKDFLIFLQNYL